MSRTRSRCSTRCSVAARLLVIVIAASGLLLGTDGVNPSQASMLKPAKWLALHPDLPLNHIIAISNLQVALQSMQAVARHMGRAMIVPQLKCSQDAQQADELWCTTLQCAASCVARGTAVQPQPQALPPPVKGHNVLCLQEIAASDATASSHDSDATAESVEDLGDSSIGRQLQQVEVDSAALGGAEDVGAGEGGGMMRRRRRRGMRFGKKLGRKLGKKRRRRRRRMIGTDLGGDEQGGDSFAGSERPARDLLQSQQGSQGGGGPLLHPGLQSQRSQQHKKPQDCTVAVWRVDVQELQALMPPRLQEAEVLYLKQLLLLSDQAAGLAEQAPVLEGCGCVDSSNANKQDLLQNACTL